MSLFGISWRPSQPFKASFNPKSIGLNDLITGASLFAPGGIAGIGNIGKWGTGNLAGNLGLSKGIQGMNLKSGSNLLGALGGLGGASGGAGNAGGTAGLAGLNSLYAQLAELQARDMLSNFPQYLAARNKSIQELDPSRIQGEIAAQRARNMGAATQAGMTGQANLEMRGINGQGALLDAMNRGVQQGNNYAAQAMSPQNIAARRQAQMGLLSGDSGLSSLLSVMGAQNNQRQINAATRQPTALEGLLGIAGQIAPYMDWNKVITKPGSSKKA